MMDKNSPLAWERLWYCCYCTTWKDDDGGERLCMVQMDGGGERMNSRVGWGCVLYGGIGRTLE